MYSMTNAMSTIEDDIATRVGRSVKARREALGIALRALASRSGVSASMISDIERGAKSPTISTLCLLADALGVPISALVDTALPAAARIHVVRGSERRAVVDPASGASRQNFGPAPAGSSVEFLRYALPPHATAGPFAAHARGTIEHVYVAAGAVRVVFGEDAVRLEGGDSCNCIADAPHLFDNADGKVEAVIYLVIERN
jgi:transcriptional regulator with XRE-family HTH domain